MGPRVGLPGRGAYRATVDCADDAAADRTACDVFGFAADAASDGEADRDGKGAKDVGSVVAPGDGVCARVVGGDHEYVDPDPNAHVTGYKSRGNGGTPTLVLEGEVGADREAPYWLKAGDRVYPAVGPGLRRADATGPVVVEQTPAAGASATGPPAGAGASLVAAKLCGAGAPSAEPDWFEECRGPVVGARFAISAGDGSAFVPTSTGATDAGGRVRFELLPPGTCRLREEGALWCHAESDSVDPAGEVVVREVERAIVWAFHCPEPTAPAQPGE